ncbi:MAG TPA: GMC oxidoreductase [bacterium]|nr:GMC oxidoreductase [bacterium]
MSRVLVVGSGASAVHFAWTLLDRGLTVEMVDVGRAMPEPVRPGDGFEELKHRLDDPVSYFLGREFEGVTYPGAAGEYYGFPPHKLVIFEGVSGWDVTPSGFAPLVSFARGGLAEAWTAGVFPFRDEELADFPFGWAELEERYARVAERIGVCGERDDLATHVPWHDHVAEPLPLDEHSSRLLVRYRARRNEFAAMGCVLGRSRIAVLSSDRGERQACGRLGRCLTGCPTGSLWVPSLGLRELEKRSGFRYRSGLRVTRLLLDDDRNARGVVAERIDGTGEEEIAAERVALGAGTLASSKIFLETWGALTGETPRLAGLMDNRQVLLPFVNLGMIPRAHDPATYQYHQLTFALDAPDPRDAVHGLVTTLKTASIHPIVQNLPVDLKTAIFVFRHLHAALGLVNVNFADRRSSRSWVALDANGRSGERPLRVHYEPPVGEGDRIRGTLTRFRRALRKLGCLVPPGMTHVRPMGSSVHYSGTLPMSGSDGDRFTTDGLGASRALGNLWFVDGTTFPFLPAKNLTFTLMANATRIADEAF